MKKTYIAPTLETYTVQTQGLCALSQVSTNGTDGNYIDGSTNIIDPSSSEIGSSTSGFIQSSNSFQGGIGWEEE